MNRRRFKMEIQDPGDFETGQAYVLMKHEDFDELFACITAMAAHCKASIPEFPFWSMTINKDDAYDA